MLTASNVIERFSDKCLIGRQPILNRFEEIVAYELLFRSPDSLTSATILDSTQASASVIVSLLSDFGAREILGKYRGFINVESDLFLSDTIELLPPDTIGLELLENTAITPEIIQRCKELKAQGFVIALDDHEYCQNHEPLYNGLAEIIKIDLHQSSLEMVYSMVDRFKPYPVKLLAEKIDTRANFLRCRSLGFELFQGYFFARPSLMQRNRLGDSAGILFELLQQLSDDADLDSIERIFKKSPVMTYKLLLLVNSVSTGLREKIRTVRHALSIIGLNQLRRWAQLAVFAAEDIRGFDNPVVDMAAVRAAFMEELATLNIQGCTPDKAFMVGILSLMKDLYDISLEEIVSGLNLSDDIISALSDRSGSLGILLKLVEMMERLEFENVSTLLGMINITLVDVLECQNKAFKWRESMMPAHQK
jgi:EAL and modified HD-GYP domain-containing signal transduction protein